MASPMYALNPNYYSSQLSTAGKKKRYLTGRGLTQDEALSSYYADIAARQAEAEAASVRSARQKQQELAEKGYELDVSKFGEAKSQFGQELAYKYDALNKEYALGQEKANLLREQMENQMAAAKIQGALQAPMALDRAIKGGKEIYSMGESAYNWLENKFATPSFGGEDSTSAMLGFDESVGGYGDMVFLKDPSGYEGVRQYGDASFKYISEFTPQELDKFGFSSLNEGGLSDAGWAQLQAKYYGGSPYDYMNWEAIGSNQGNIMFDAANNPSMIDPISGNWMPLTKDASGQYSFAIDPSLVQSQGIYEGVGMGSIGLEGGAMGADAYGAAMAGQTADAAALGIGSGAEVGAEVGGDVLASQLGGMSASAYLMPFSAGSLGGRLSRGVEEFGDVATLGHMFGGEADTRRAGGFLAGALSGAAVGTVTIPIPVVGTIIGGILGGLGGLFGSWK